MRHDPAPVPGPHRENQGMTRLETATPPDFQGAIGVTQTEVEGVDITVPVYHFSETHDKADAENTGAGALVKRPVAAYVEKVYEEGDFSALGIGT